MVNQQYYFEKVLGLFWTHVKMEPEGYLKLYNEFRETIQIIPNIEQTEGTKEIIRLDCDFFTISFDEFSETCCKFVTKVKTDFDSILSDVVKQKSGFVKLSGYIEYVEKDYIPELIKHLDILTGMNISINTHSIILLEKIRYLLEFVRELNRSIIEERSVFEDVNKQTLLKHISQVMTEVLRRNDEKTSSIISCEYKNTSYEVKMYQNGQSMVCLEIFASTPLTKLFQESLTNNDAEKILIMINNMISKGE